jgi:hypothetical protein
MHREGRPDGINRADGGGAVAVIEVAAVLVDAADEEAGGAPARVPKAAFVADRNAAEYIGVASSARRLVRVRIPTGAELGEDLGDGRQDSDADAREPLPGS